MRSLISRIHSLERDRPCWLCRGKGKFVVTYDDKPTPPGAGCPECGKMWEVRVRYVEESFNGKRNEEADDEEP